MECSICTLKIIIQGNFDLSNGYKNNEAQKCQLKLRNTEKSVKVLAVILLWTNNFFIGINQAPTVITIVFQLW